MNQNKPQNLIKGSLVYSIGNIGTLVINFFLVPLYTFYLSKDELGYFDILASTIVIIAPIFFGHIELAVLRWLLASKDSPKISVVISNSLAIFLIGSLIFTAAYFVVNTYLTWKLSGFVYVYFISNFFYIIAKQIIRSVYSPMHYVGTELIYTLAVLSGILILVKEYTLRGIFISYGLASTMLLIYLAFLGLNKFLSVKLIKGYRMKELLSYSAPLIPNTFGLWLNNMSPKYFILLFLGLGANGIYAIAVKIAFVLQILNRIFYMSFQDEMFKIYGNEGHQRYFSEVLQKYMKILFSLLYLMIAFQELILPFIIDANFLEATNYIPILGFGVLFMSLSNILGIIYQCEKRNINASKTSAISGTFIVLGSFIAIPVYGLYAASAVFCLGNLLLFLYRDFDTRKYNFDKINHIQLVLFIILGLILWILSILATAWTDWTACILAIVASALLNRSVIKKQFRALLTKRL